MNSSIIAQCIVCIICERDMERFFVSLNSKERFNELKETGKLPSPAGAALAIIQLTEREGVHVEKVLRLTQTDPASRAAC